MFALCTFVYDIERRILSCFRIVCRHVVRVVGVVTSSSSQVMMDSYPGFEDAGWVSGYITTGDSTTCLTQIVYILIIQQMLFARPETRP